MTAKNKEEKKNLGFWRENAEALTFAIVMALVIKQFAFEAYKVPTSSMEPTIIGRDTGGARLIANKFAYMLSDPERYDVVIFQYPHNRLLSYVKRCVGVGPEWVFIRGGDLYSADFDLDRAEALNSAKILRKPYALQSRLFDQSPCIPPEDRGVDRFRSYWQSADNDTSPNIRPDSEAGVLRIEAKETPVRMRFTRPSSALQNVGGEGFEISTKRYDDWSVRAPERGALGIMLGLPFPSKNDSHDTAMAVGDIRLRFEVQPDSKDGAVILEIHDWSHGQKIVAEIPVDSGKGELQIGDKVVEIDAKVLSGEWTEVLLANYDNHVVVEVDGEIVAESDYDHALMPAQNPVLNDSQILPPLPGLESEGELVRQDNTAIFGFKGGKAQIRELDVCRDIYYTETGVTDFHIPAENFLMLGDNPPESLDARAWKVSEMKYKNEDGEIQTLYGDSEGVSDAPTRPGKNPYENDTRFLDVFGNTRKIEASGIQKVEYKIDEERTESLSAVIRYGNLVPRKYVQGRAYFTFFPIMQIGVIQ